MCLPKLYATFKDLRAMTDFVSLEIYVHIYGNVWNIKAIHKFQPADMFYSCDARKFELVWPNDVLYFFCHNHGVVHLCVVKMQ